ncbi:hypothetical protein [Dactylosporangium sp. CA-092794]|uniref:hypothetical protein n=1 Tax=Dactylosporangium sp. CA-092794 TaxID=3239929 RepID=UPI003D8E942E
MQEGDLEAYVCGELRSRNFPAVWSMLLYGQYVEEVMVGGQDPDWLVERAREIRSLLTARPVDTLAASVANVDGPDVGEERMWALSQLVARDAAEDPDVVRFRAAYLPGGLIARSEVEDWLNNQADRDGERTSDVSFTIPPGTAVEWDGPVPRFDPPIAAVTTGVHFSSRLLAYALPGDRGVRRRTVTANGGLDQLGQLSMTLATTFSWQAAQATVFVLTGVPPMIAAVRTTVPVVKVRYESELDWARRIVLDVDPGASSREVVSAFERARAEYHHAGRRRTTVKHLRLAAFAGAEHADKPWAERFRLWNERFPDWAYPQQSNFRRDAAAAERRLLSP